jgi:hypothetical protein
LLLIVHRSATWSVDIRGQLGQLRAILGASELNPKGVAPIMSLTKPTILNVKPSRKTVKLFDERGLYLEVSPSGGRWWLLKYRYEGKEKQLSGCFS